MNICKKCNSTFKNYEFINGKQRNLSSRIYCLDCSPFGKGGRRLMETPVDYVTPRVCSLCGKEYIYDRNKGHRSTMCNSCKTVRSDRKKKSQAVKYLGGKCKGCGYNKCVEALVFHHLVPEDKEFYISRNYSKPWNLLKKEIDKCILLCHNCHTEIHAGVRQL